QCPMSLQATRSSCREDPYCILLEFPFQLLCLFFHAFCLAISGSRKVYNEGTPGTRRAIILGVTLLPLHEVMQTCWNHTMTRNAVKNWAIFYVRVGHASL